MNTTAAPSLSSLAKHIMLDLTVDEQKDTETKRHQHKQSDDLVTFFGKQTLVNN